jgi:hypothetical protein
MPQLEGAASLVIGLLLTGVAVLLIRDLAVAGRRKAFAPNGIWTSQAAWPVGPDERLVTMDLDFDDGAAAVDAAAAIPALERDVLRTISTQRGAAERSRAALRCLALGAFGPRGKLPRLLDSDALNAHGLRHGREIRILEVAFDIQETLAR